MGSHEEEGQGSYPNRKSLNINAGASLFRGAPAPEAMQIKKPLRRAAGGIFFITCFFNYTFRWKNRAELQRIGLEFNSSGIIELNETTAELVHALITAGTCPEKLCRHENEIYDEMRRIHDEMCRYYFFAYAHAPNYVIKLMLHLRGKATPMRRFFQTENQFKLNGRVLTLNDATDGEIARAIVEKFGKEADYAKGTVKLERRQLRRVVDDAFRPGSKMQQQIYAYFRPKV